jgi:methyltransferase (TIGR00027 family)
MAEKRVGNTALGAAICRLIEQYQPENKRLFTDPLAKAMVDAPIGFLLRFAFMRNFTVRQTDSVAEGIFGEQICRTRYIDDVASAGLAEGIRQLVILGAGLDTRPCRLPGVEQVKVFEVDLPIVQANKKKKVIGHLGRVPSNVTYIPIDFDTQPLETVFSSTTYDITQPAVFLWEGVSQYVTAEAASRIFAFVGKAAQGSTLVFTYVLKSIIEHRSNLPGIEKMLDTVARQGSAWIFGLEQSENPAYLERFHLHVAEDVGNSDYQERYLQPLGRNLFAFEGERIVRAAVV